MQYCVQLRKQRQELFMVNILNEITCVVLTLGLNLLVSGRLA